ncbi:MAG: PEP-CTERM sorting domain-containing protein [Armatimonadota bacterium]
MQRRIMLAVSLALALVTGAYAQVTVSAEAVNNATVQPAGPRSGTAGKNFFNVEGNNKGQYASFGVADFSASSFGLSLPVADITGIRLVLIEDRASFSAAGGINIWLSEDTTTDIEPGTSPLAWDASDLPNGLGSQLVPRYYLGSGTYTPTLDGTVFSYTLSLTPNAKSYLISQLNSAGAIRILVSPTDDDVAATYAGYSHSSLAGPTLELDVVPVPEPASLTAVAMGVLGILWRKRRTA